MMSRITEDSCGRNGFPDSYEWRCEKRFSGRRQPMGLKKKKKKKKKKKIKKKKK
jgi:hypothetical protein